MLVGDVSHTGWSSNRTATPLWTYMWVGNWMRTRYLVHPCTALNSKMIEVYVKCLFHIFPSLSGVYNLYPSSIEATRSPFSPDAVGLSTPISSLPAHHWATALELFEAVEAKAGPGWTRLDPVTGHGHGAPLMGKTMLYKKLWKITIFNG